MTGRGRGKWKFLDKRDEMFGNKHATRLPVVILIRLKNLLLYFQMKKLWKRDKETKVNVN